MQFNLAIAYRIMREYSLSLETYQQSLVLDPSGSMLEYNGLGFLSYAQGKESSAIGYFHRSLQLSYDPNYGTFRKYWTNAHDIHMLIVALVGAGNGYVALQRLQQVIKVLKWEPGVLTELLWDMEQFEEINPSLPALAEILALLRNTNLNIEKHIKGPLRSSDVYCYL